MYPSTKLTKVQTEDGGTYLSQDKEKLLKKKKNECVSYKDNVLGTKINCRIVIVFV